MVGRRADRGAGVARGPGRRILALVAFLALLAAIVAVRLPQRAFVWAVDGARGQAPPNDALRSEESVRLRVMTWNMLCSVCLKRGYEGLAARAPHLRARIVAHDPDVVAVQELAGRRELDAVFGGSPWAHVAFGRGRWADAAIVYRADRLRARDDGALWLSPTPTVPFGWPWRAWSVPRLVVWALLEDPDGGRVLVTSTHFDAASTNKRPSASLFGTTFPPLSDRVPLVAAGDFNLRADDTAFDAARGSLVDAERIATAVERLGPLDLPYTRPELRPERRIDHLLVPPDAAVARFVHDATAYVAADRAPRRPSDHPAVVADVVLLPRP